MLKIYDDMLDVLRSMRGTIVAIERKDPESRESASARGQQRRAQCRGGERFVRAHAYGSVPNGAR